MAYSAIAEAVLAGNAADATIYTVPAGSSALISNITGHNSTAGSLNLSIRVKENNSTNTISQIVSMDPIPAGATRYYGREQTAAACPIMLKAGQLLQGSASGTGVMVRISGLLLT